jgi:DNA helicase-2/ATP-dependent DNA helicase PcrA
MEEGLLPHGRTLSEGSTDDIGEERRLAYVGITRARKVLTMSAARIRLKYGKIERRKVSRFIYEIPEALLDGGYGGGAQESVVETAEEKHTRVMSAFDDLSKLLG